MKCHICDKTLSDAEIQISPDKITYEPCAVCMEIILDAAYSDGFIRPDDLDGVEILDDDEMNNTEIDEIDSWGLPTEELEYDSA